MISVIDYCAGNVGSVIRMIEKCAGSAGRILSACELDEAETAILPGRGRIRLHIGQLAAARTVPY